MKNLISISTLALLAFMSSAEAFVSHEGHRYDYTCNEHGMVLKSAFPVSRFIEGGAGSKVIEETEIIYLGKNCDARHRLFGNGRLRWANGGFWVNFDNVFIEGISIMPRTHEIYFPRQEILCENWTTSCSG
jgi:hypothetical protein